MKIRLVLKEIMKNAAKGLRIQCVNKDSWEQLVWINFKKMSEKQIKRIKNRFSTAHSCRIVIFKKQAKKYPGMGEMKIIFYT